MQVHCLCGHLSCGLLKKGPAAARGLQCRNLQGSPNARQKNGPSFWRRLGPLERSGIKGGFEPEHRTRGLPVVPREEIAPNARTGPSPNARMTTDRPGWMARLDRATDRNPNPAGRRVVPLCQISRAGRRPPAEAVLLRLLGVDVEDVEGVLELVHYLHPPSTVRG